MVDPKASPTTDLQRLTEVLEGVFKGKSGDNKVEDVKMVPELPRLDMKDNERELMPLIAGDWLATIGPSLRDLSAHATDWWSEVLETAQHYYARWLESGPVERLVMVPDRPARFDKGPYVRVEQRAVSLLLKAVPQQIKEDVVAMRRLTTIEIIGTILTTYQPGGLKERTALLKFLTTPEASKSITEALKGVRRWARWRKRATELRVSIPDATLLIGGLDQLTQPVIAQYPEVQFRLQTFRHQHTVDHIPTEEKAASLGQMLQAELQVLEHSGPLKKPKLARMEDGGESLGDTGKSGKPENKAKGLGKKGKDGKAGVAAGESKACYHWMSRGGCRMGKECKFYHDRQQLSNATDVANRCFTCSGVGHRAAECPATSGAASSKGTGDGSQKGAKVSAKGTPKGPGAKRVEEDPPALGDQAKLITAATNLLEQMQAKALSARPHVHQLQIKSQRTGLIDSGASTCLRQAKGDEPQGLLRKTVDLAQGTADLYVTICGTLVAVQPVETIVALGPLIRMGCRLQWGDKECVLWHPKRGRVQLEIGSGCPRVTEDLALELIEEIEQHRMSGVSAAVRAIRAKDSGDLTDPTKAISNLTQAVLREDDVSVCLGEAVLALWPQTPHGLLQDLTAWSEVDAASVTFNRRTRRAVDKAEKVLLHLCAGESRREIERIGTQKGYTVLSVGESEDLTSPQTYGYLLKKAAEGKVTAKWAAPPCGTNTLCRFIQPGPRPLRGRSGKDRWGLADLSEQEKIKTRKADELYLRSLLIMHVAAEGNRQEGKDEPWDLLENPQDPESYIKAGTELWKASRTHGGFPSFVATDEFKASAGLLGMRCFNGDQGPYGHAKRKPTTWASTRELPTLMRGPGNGLESDEPLGQQWPSARWAKWAPGMIGLFASMLDEDKPKLSRAEMNWDAHVKSGHWPPSRQCRTCIAASAKQRPHRRIASPSSWSLAVDTIGPFKKAEDETSNNLRYVLVACLLVPVDGKGRPVLGPDQKQEELSPDEREALKPLDEGQDEPGDDSQDNEYAGLWAFEDDNIPNDEPEPAVKEQAMDACKEDAKGFNKAELECRVEGLRWKELVFTEPIRRKTPAAAEQAVTKVIMEISELGFPSTRIHSDSGSEFINDHMRRLVTKYGLKHTCSAPEEHNSNGRIENVVQRLKSQVRTYLHGDRASEMHLWPLAIRAASAVWRAQTLRGMGFPAPNVVPYGTKTQVLARTWLRRSAQQAWSLRAVPAQVMCPASLVKLGYVVRIGKRLSVVTKLFEGQDPPLKTELQATCDDPPLAHSIGPETRVPEKATRPNMSHIPNPKRRFRYKAPGPGRVPVLSKLEDLNLKGYDIEENTPDEPTCGGQEAVERIMNSSWLDTAANDGNNPNNGQHLLFGVYKSEAGMVLSDYCKLRPEMCRMLNVLAKICCPGTSYCTMILSVKTKMCLPPMPCPFSVICLGPWNMECSMWKMKSDGNGATEARWQDVSHASTVKTRCRMATFSSGERHLVTQRAGPTCELMVLHGTPNEEITAQAQHMLKQLGFVVPEQHDKGGGHPESVHQIQCSSFPHSSSVLQHEGPGESVHERRQCSSFPHSSSVLQHEGSGESVQASQSGSSFPHSTSVLQHEGSGESVQASQSGSSFPHSISVLQHEGSGESVQTSQSGSSFPHAISVLQHEGSGESSVQVGKSCVCRICETVEVVDDSGRCKGCGCWIFPEGVSVPCVKAAVSAPQTENPKNPKNGIGPKYKNGINYKQDVTIAGGPDERREHGHSRGELPTGASWPQVGVVGGRWTSVVTKLGSVSAWIAETVGSFGADGLEEPYRFGAGEDAEGPDYGSKDAESESRGEFEVGAWLVEHVLAGSEYVAGDEAEAGGNSANEADPHEPRRDGLVAREHVACEATEQLRVVADVTGPCDVVQKDITAFAAWLDERQLRLSSLHQDELQTWVNDETPGSDDELVRRNQIQRIWEDIEDLRYELRSLNVQQLSEDIGQLEAEAASDEAGTILQTRIIANTEVMAKWDLWEGSTRTEIESLVQDKEALEVSTQRVLDQLQARGTKVTLIPSKVIYSLKAPCGRRKCRLVACGNYLSTLEDSKQAHKQAVYTPSIGIESLRTGLAFSVRRNHTFLTIDIKTAFLNANLLPRDRQEAQEAVGSKNPKYDGVKAQAETHSLSRPEEPLQPGELVALIPPRMLITKGIFGAGDRLVVRKAVYGLDQSPRDWGFVRDSRLAQLVIEWEKKEFRMYRSYAEDSMWLISTKEPVRGREATDREQSLGEIAAWAAVYVDDIFIAGPKGLAQATVKAIRECWECTEPQEVGSDPCHPVRFLGMDLGYDQEGNLTLSQESYLKELGQRYTQELKGIGKPMTPMSPAFCEDTVEENATVEQTRRVQGLVGELLWASIRTRPDAAYAVSKLAGHLSRAPVSTFNAALHTLAYLLATSEARLTYWKGSRRVWEEFRRSLDPVGSIEGFGDASFAPEARRSMQCLQIFTEGSLTAWSVTRQAFMAQSSCEAEMIALMDLANYTISMSFLLDELLQRRASRVLAGDNVAALAIYGGTAMHWRTRHLRIRAKAFAEKYEEGSLPAVHVPGEWNPSDIGTKGLSGARHWKLCDLLGLNFRKDEVRKVVVKSNHAEAVTCQCLRAVILACCLVASRAQPGLQDREAGGDWLLFAVILMGMVATIAMWEACRQGFAYLRALCSPRPHEPEPYPPLPPPREAPIEALEPQPDAEDDLRELPDTPDRAQEREEREGERLAREREAREAQEAFEEGLRRRGARVYGPEPDDEPRPPTPPRALHATGRPDPVPPEQPLVMAYADDVVVQIPEARARVHAEPAREVYAAGLPPRPRRNEEGGGPRVRLREEVLEGVRRREEEMRRLDMPPSPPLVVCPAFAPSSNSTPIALPSVELYRVGSPHFGTSSSPTCRH